MNNKKLSESKMNINYDEVLDSWAEKVLSKADMFNKKSDDVEFGSKDYIRYKSYSEGLYMATAMLSNEERKYKRKYKII